MRRVQELPSIVGRELVIDPESFGGPAHRLVDLTPPHAPSFVTTLSPNGTVNIGSFEQTMVCSNVPPTIILAISTKSDTLHNILDHEECVIGFLYPELIQQLYDGGVRLPRGCSELPLLHGITLAPSRTVAPPRVEQCWFSAEARLAWAREVGDHTALGMEVQSITFDERLCANDRVLQRTGLPSLYYACNGHFFRPGPTIVVEGSDKVRAIGRST